MELDNPTPEIHHKHAVELPQSNLNDTKYEPISSLEIFDHIRTIRDPEHPLSLEQLNIVQPDHCHITTASGIHKVLVEFTPTIPHCSMASLVGLSINVRLLRCLPRHWKIRVQIKKGSHANENSLNRQLADKERVSAALENPNLIKVVNSSIYSL